MKLLVRPDPAAEECYADYAARLAECNGLMSVLALFESKNRPDGIPTVIDGVELGVEPALLRHINLRYAPGTHRRIWRNLEFGPTGPMLVNLRICPACLAEDRPRCVLWRLRNSVGCLRHRARLLSRCPTCNADFRSWEGRWRYCFCGFDLRLAATLPLEPGAFALQCLVEGAHLPSLSLGEKAVQETSVRALWGQPDTEEFLACLARCVAPRTPGKRMSLLANDEAWLATSELLVDWPDRALSYYQRRWSENLQARAQGQEDVRFRINVFNLLAFCARANVAAPVAEFGRQLQAVCDTVEECFAVSPLRKRRITSETDSYVSVSTAIRTLGADRALIERLVHDGFIPIERGGGKSPVRRLPRALLPELSTFLLGLLTGREVMGRLGVNAALLKGLVRARVLRMVEKRAQTIRGHFLKQDVDRLLARLDAVAAKSGPDAQRRSRLGSYTPKPGASQANAPVVAAGIVLQALKGEIPIYREPDGEGLARFSIATFAIDGSQRAIAMSTLLVRSVRQADESWCGFQLRLASENGLSKFAWLPPETSGTPLQPEQTVRFARHCPQCLAEGAVWKEAWTWSGLPVCTRHGVALRDRCVSCRRPLTWFRVSYRRCACGHDLAGPGDTLSNLARRLALALGGDVSSSVVAEHLSMLPLRSLSRLLVDLGAPVVRADGEKPVRTLKRANLAECLRVFDAAAEALTDFPGSFDEYLKRIMDRRLRKRRIGPAQVFAEIGKIKGYLKPPEVAFLDDALAKFLASHWTQPVTRRSRWLTSERPDLSRYVALAKVAKSMTRRIDGVAELARRHGVAILTVGEDSVRPRRYVDKQEVELLEIAAHEEITSKAAALLLGIHRSRMRDLLGQGIVPLTHTLRRVWYAARGPLTALADELWERARPTPDSASVDLVPLNEVLRYPVKANQTAPLFEALFDGTLATWRREPFIRLGDDLLVSNQEVRVWAIGKLPEEYMSAPDAARTLGIKQEALYDLIALGLIRSEIRPGRRRHQRAISARAINEFRERYVGASELAKKWSTNSAAVVRRLHNHGIKPCATRAKCHKVYFLRGAVERARLRAPKDAVEPRLAWRASRGGGRTGNAAGVPRERETREPD